MAIVSIRNRFLLASLLLLSSRASSTAAPTSTTTTTTSQTASDATCGEPPYVVLPTAPARSIEEENNAPMQGGSTLARLLRDDSESELKFSNVYGCCSSKDDAKGVANGSCPGENDDMAIATAAAADATTSASYSTLQRRLIGKMPRMTEEQAMQVLETARQAWAGGSGTWTQYSLKQRIACVQKFLVLLTKERETIVNVLMWEIGKHRKDAEAEFDRTIEFAEKTIQVLQTTPEFDSHWEKTGSTWAFVRRNAIGVILCLGPYNYPINETYATMIPALLMGNIILLKLPTVGGLAHLVTMEALAKALPANTVNFVGGSGRATMPPILSSGKLDGLAFIGGSDVADDLIKKHPEPHRFKVFLQLEAKNMAVYFPDLFEPPNVDALKLALDETLLGALSFNGQRCTALKIVMVPKGKGQEIANAIAARVEEMRIGLPWQVWYDDDDGANKKQYPHFTPLPNRKRIDFLTEMIRDATSKGARIMNTGGGTVIGGDESTLMIPAVLYPVTPDMRVYSEEQFGPVVPVAEYESLHDVVRSGQSGKYAQQVSLFTATGGFADGGNDGTTIPKTNNNSVDVTTMIDQFAAVFGKINLNSQCGRSPDTIPFAGRRSAAMGVMSVRDAIREFSVPTVVAYKENGSPTSTFIHRVQETSSFLESL